jgi:hypothetical protein
MAAGADDVLDALARGWAASGLNVLVAGGLQKRFVAGSMQLPYAWATAAPLRRMGVAGRAYLETFLVVVRVYSADAGQRRKIERGLETLNWSQRWWTGPACKVVEVRPADVPSRPADAPTVARDVVESAAAWDVMVQQKKG